MRQLHEHYEVVKLHIEVVVAVGCDLASFAQARADALVNASLNNDAHGVENILRSYKQKSR